jgi:hypothetical protein
VLIRYAIPHMPLVDTTSNPHAYMKGTYKSTKNPIYILIAMHIRDFFKNPSKISV